MKIDTSQDGLTSRRMLIRAATGACALSLVHPTPLLSQSFRRIPQKPSARVIVDNDFAGDPDGLIALAHQLLTPKTRVPLITVSALDPKFSGGMPMAGQTAKVGGETAIELLRRAGISKPPPVVVGSETFSSAPSAAARAIVAEALREDALPLFLTCGGPLTNVSAALRLEPAIAKRMTVVWIGGGAWPAGGWEYNLATDMAAARHVIEESQVPIWQVPQDSYRQMQYSIAEMASNLRPISSFTQWLYDRFTDPPAFMNIGGTWPLGDSPLVLLTALSTDSSRSTERNARRIGVDFSYGEELPGRKIRVFETLDARLTFADFLALLQSNAAR